MSVDSDPARDVGDARLLELLQEVGRGKAGAFDELYDATSHALYGLVMGVVGDDVLAARVTQGCYVQLCRQAARFDAGWGSVLSWMTRTAHRRAVECARTAQLAHRPQPERVVDSAHDHGHTDGAGPRRVATAGPQPADELLSTPVREAVDLAYFGGCTVAEVADRLGVSVDVVVTRLRDGLIRLRDAGPAAGGHASGRPHQNPS